MRWTIQSECYISNKENGVTCTTAWHHLIRPSVHFMCTDNGHILALYYYDHHLYLPANCDLEKQNRGMVSLSSYRWRRLPSCWALHWAAGGSHTPPSPQPQCDLHCCLPAKQCKAFSTATLSWKSNTQKTNSYKVTVLCNSSVCAEHMDQCFQVAV